MARPSLNRDSEKMLIRLPEGMKERIGDAANQANQSMNALVVSALEQAFPQPSINLHDLAAFLAGAWSEADEGDPKGYVTEVNRALASAKKPWTMKIDDFGVVSFFPFAENSAKG